MEIKIYLTLVRQSAGRKFLFDVCKNRLHFTISLLQRKPIWFCNRFWRNRKMAKLIVWNLVTLDGYFEGDKKWDLDFHNTAWGPELEKMSLEFGASAEALVFGRVTYEGMRDYWTTTTDEGPVKDFMNALPKLVASRTLTSSNWNNTRVTADIGGEIARLKADAERDLYVFGSADLIHSLLEQGLVDEILLCVVPRLLGSGTLLFKKGARHELTLAESRPLSNGSLIVRYSVTK
jgi:dihydrofolate reductase